MTVQSEIETHTNSDGTTNWAKIEAGECREYFRFERIGHPGFGWIECQGGVWRAGADNGKSSNSRDITREQAIATVAKIKAAPGFKIIRDHSQNI